MKRYPCRQCERSFNASNSLRRHIRNNHDTAKKVYTCWYVLNATFQICFQRQANLSSLEALCDRSCLLLSTPGYKLLRESEKNNMLNMRDLVAKISPCF